MYGTGRGEVLEVDGVLVNASGRSFALPFAIGPKTVCEVISLPVSSRQRTYVFPTACSRASRRMCAASSFSATFAWLAAAPLFLSLRSA